MRFPGQRKSKHYFPKSHRDPVLEQLRQVNQLYRPTIVGIVQSLVDVEAKVSDELLERYGLTKGNSVVLTEDDANKLYNELRDNQLITHQHPGGTIGNTLHNYSVIADSKSIMLGVMSHHIAVGSYAYQYLCKTSARVNLNHLQTVEGAIGSCYTLITEDGERTFAINKGMMNYLDESGVPESVFDKACALVISSYLMRAESHEPMSEAVNKAIRIAKSRHIPIVLTLGTKFIIQDDPQWWQRFIAENVNILAMNEEEGAALTGKDDPLLAAHQALEWCDLVLCTAGPSGLYMAGYCDESMLRTTDSPLLPGAIPEFNQFEYSRGMLKQHCQQPVKVYSHIGPYLGGPNEIKNTNGAGDAAMSALLHDVAANVFHAHNIPNSTKHDGCYLTYSSLSQISKYANRVSYEVLSQHSPRLSRGLPEREESLEEAYWDK